MSTRTPTVTVTTPLLLPCKPWTGGQRCCHVAVHDQLRTTNDECKELLSACERAQHDLDRAKHARDRLHDELADAVAAGNAAASSKEALQAQVAALTQDVKRLNQEVRSCAPVSHRHPFSQ